MDEGLKKLKSHSTGGSVGERNPQLIRHKSFVSYTNWAMLASTVQSELGKARKPLQESKGVFWHTRHPPSFPASQKDGAGDCGDLGFEELLAPLSSTMKTV